MAEHFPVIDTCFTIGVGPMVHFIAEEQLDEHMTRNGVDLQIVYQPDESFFHRTPDWNPYLGNDYIAKIQKQFSGRVMGLATIQAWHQAYHCDCGKEICPYGVDKTINHAMEELDRAILDLGLYGLRINPSQHNCPLDNRDICWPLLRRVLELQKITGRKMIISVYSYGDHIFNTPESVMETAREFPDLTFLMQHCGFVWGCGMLADTAAQMENVFLDLSAMPQFDVVLASIKRFGLRKLCIGTDGPYADYAMKMAIIDDYCHNTLERELILGGNLAQYLGITELK